MHSTFVVLENTAKLKLVSKQISSDEGRELYHFLARCFDVQIRENTIANPRNISFLKHWIYIFQG